MNTCLEDFSGQWFIGKMKIPTTTAYCPVVNVFAARAGPWISRSFFISFLTFLRFGTLLTNFSLGLSGKTISIWAKERETKLSTNESLRQRSKEKKKLRQLLQAYMLPQYH